MPKDNIEQDINSFLDKWDCKQLIRFFQDVMPLMELYNVDTESDWVRDEVGEGNERDIRLIRTVYLLSRIVDTHSGVFSSTRANFPKMWQKMENINAVKQERSF